MATKERQGTKRSKSYYRKCAFGSKKARIGANVLQADIKGFLVMCNSNEKSAVRETYNILNEYADEQQVENQPDISENKTSLSDVDLEAVRDVQEDSDDDDVEKALQKEVEEIKTAESTEKRFQNVLTNAKNCIFIRSNVSDPVRLVITIMNDIAIRHLKRARYAARIIPVIGTCKARTADIEQLCQTALKPYLSQSDFFTDCFRKTHAVENPNSDISVAKSLKSEDLCSKIVQETHDNKDITCDKQTSQKSRIFTVVFKARNNNTTTCGKESVIPVVVKAVKDINSNLEFSWNKYDFVVLIEIVCTICCVGLAPDYFRLRKYNLQELQKGAREDNPTNVRNYLDENELDRSNELESQEKPTLEDKIENKKVSETEKN